MGWGGVGMLTYLPSTAFIRPVTRCSCYVNMGGWGGDVNVPSAAFIRPGTRCWDYVNMGWGATSARGGVGHMMGLRQHAIIVLSYFQVHSSNLTQVLCGTCCYTFSCSYIFFFCASLLHGRRVETPKLLLLHFSQMRVICQALCQLHGFWAHKQWCSPTKFGGSKLDSIFSLSLNQQVLQSLVTDFDFDSSVKVSLPPLLGLWCGIDAFSINSLQFLLRHAHRHYLSALGNASNSSSADSTSDILQVWDPWGPTQCQAAHCGSRRIDRGVVRTSVCQEGNGWALVGVSRKACLQQVPTFVLGSQRYRD